LHQAQAFDTSLLEVLQRHGADVVVLIGFMRIVTPVLTNAYRWRMINVHPSLLPDFAGGMDTGVHEAVIAAKARVTGCTVHFVTEEVDGGATIVQRACPVHAITTAEELKATVQALEGQVR